MDHAVELPSHLLFSRPEITHGFDEFLKTATACTHTHTCNPPGPSAATHTHTCLHTHLQVFASGENTTIVEEGDLRKPRKPLGNREAVRKYREKKKAHAAFLEEEVKKLRTTNQQLLKRLHGYAALEAEVVRLRGLLFDVRVKIDSEIDSCDDFQKHWIVGSVRCTDPSPYFDTDAELAAPEESHGPTVVDFEIEQSGNTSRDLDNPDADNLMDAVANLVN
ncbi:hypothetical protein PR202_gb04495 [Eleusine coracana subsp. coracana]|uniref:BZIP domain-containing protein n=1 Tax=Eleusine coracana subsp. coracana TaxID=191504 RepID=A0AAV5E3X7_ELECO|nr:hypothetical protein QOZ80_1BG0086840 [Eleusine coracana subsp. coracana]GJN17432.1 hypothetical protein PR202_gb04495 [Eleusine coracana subsp. coracana]